MPDKRFITNIISIAERMDEHAGSSYSAACGERLRKCAWRLFSAAEPDLPGIHQQRTPGRCAGEETILVAEDTTDLRYRSAKGLTMHTILAMTTQGQPPGIVHQQIGAPKANNAGTQRRLLLLKKSKPSSGSAR